MTELIGDLAEWNRKKIYFAQSSLPVFISSIFPNYLLGWCHFEICEKLDKFFQDVQAQKSPRLIITMPPRSGKSEIVSRAFPAYLFGKNPDIKIIAASRSISLAKDFNRDVQRIMSSETYREIFPDSCLAKASSRGQGGYVRTSDMFEIVNAKGTYISAGIGTQITGRGADVFIIDDYVKDRAEAASPTIRNKTWDWYTSTAYTRLSPGGGVIVMATRWSCDDLIGRLLDAQAKGEGDTFELVNYEAIASKDEPNRKKGEALHPDRFPLSELLKIKKVVGERDWASLYQQSPVPDGGALFKSNWLRYWTDETLPPHFDMVLLSWDMAFKGDSSSDYVVGQVWGKKASSFYLIDQFRGQWDFVQSRSMFVMQSKKYPQATAKLVEDKANGAAIISELKKVLTGIIPITPTESKEARAYAVTPYFEAGNVFIPAVAPWRVEYEQELLQFPAASHDDQVDATTQALSYFNRKAPIIFTPEIIKQLRTPPKF